MKKLVTGVGIILSFLAGMMNLSAQNSGDYRSAANGDWSTAATWEIYDGSAWAAAASAPTGSENITIDDSVAADAAINITGYIKVIDAGKLAVTGGSVTFGSGSTYEHARNGGTMPAAVWSDSSLCLVTGAVSTAPGNANQDFYNFTWNCAGQTSNLNTAWSGNTIRGDLTCISSGGSRFQMSNNTAFQDTITVEGNIVVSGGTLASNGSSGAATYEIVVNGNINVTGGNFSLSRGSGGIANWYVKGNLSASNSTIQTSNNSSQLLFAGVDTQMVSLSTVTFTGTINYAVLTGAKIKVIDNADEIDFQVNGNLINEGVVAKETNAVINFGANAWYRHARASGYLPLATWTPGSTCEITGATSQAPENRNQNFSNVIFNCPNQTANLNMGWDDVTISGNIQVISTGASSRWYMTAPTSGDTAIVNILGDIIQTGGQFASNGTGNNNTTIIINQYGDIIATAGNFSVGRGSQGGTGTVDWNLYGDSLVFADVTTQNSNAAGARFVFKGTTPQVLSLSNVTFGGGGFPVIIDSGAVVDMGTSQVAGNGLFTVLSGAGIIAANAGGLDSAIQSTGTVTIAEGINVTYNGTTAQITGAKLPAAVNNLTINNPEGVTLSGNTAVAGTLSLTSGDLSLNGFTVDLGTTGMLAETAGNTVKGTTGIITAVRTLNAPSAVNIAGMGLVLTTAANPGITTLTRFHSAPTGQGNVGINRTYFFEAEHYNSLNATVRFYYDESELNSTDEATLGIFESWTGMDNTWVLAGGMLNAADNYIELTGVDSIRNLGAANSGLSLPVELTSFSAAVNKDKVILSWATATEINNRGWDIERKAGNSGWVKAGFVPGAGNRTEKASYSFEDSEAAAGLIQYRLKQLDFDGTFEYSKTVEIELNSLPKEFALHQNYPNPFNPSTTFRFEIAEAAHVNLSVYNMIGEKVAEVINEQMEAGYYTKAFDGSNLSSGMYIYRLSAGNNNFTKKMLLIK